SCLLQNPQRPSLRAVDRVAPDDRSIHADKRDRSHSADKEILLDPNIPRLVPPVGGKGLQRGTEKFQPRAAADVDSALSIVLETAVLHPNPRCAAFGLHGVGAALAERAVRNPSPMTAYHIHPGAAVAPPLENAVLDGKILQAGELDAIPVAFRPD